jgi:hypothetical protein
MAPASWESQHDSPKWTGAVRNHRWTKQCHPYQKITLQRQTWLENLLQMAGWWYTYPSEKYDFVSWDDYSQYMKK